MFLRTAFVATAFALAAPVFAAPEDDLIEALGVPQMVQIMREEGQGYGADLGRDMLPGGSDAAWEAVVDRIYDTDAMLETVRAGFAEEIEGTDLDPLLDYFTSDAGARIVGLEISAREAMVSEDVEEAARDAYRMAAAEEDPSLEPLEALIEANDLVEANVVGALNASFAFYKGLADGGGLEMSEAEMLSDVWGQEDETRADTREWLFAYMMLAYGPLGEEALADYVALSETTEGQALNRALFAGFNDMYDKLSYALGLALSQQMQGQDL